MIKILILEPDAAPQNVTAVKKTSNSILVTWDEVPNGKRNGRIQKYRVDYTSAADNEQKSKEVNASIKYLEINGLQHNTKYSTAVSASTSKGYGPASKPIFVATDQDGSKSRYALTRTNVFLSHQHQKNYGLGSFVAGCNVPS